MKRRLIKQGKDTLTITLPRGWIKKYGMVPGDEIEVDEQGRVLVLSTEKGIMAPKTTIYTKGLDANMIWRVFSAAYRSGYDEIEIVFDDLKKKYSKEPKELFTSHPYPDKKATNIVELVQGMVNRYVGMEIIDQKTTYCVVKDVMKINEAEFDNALRRIFLLLLTLSNDCMVSLKEKKKGAFSSIDVTDSNIDRFAEFCMRIINKKGYKDYKKSSEIYSIIILLEFLGDEYKRLSKIALEVDKPSQKLIKNFEKVNELVRQYYELFYGDDIKKINDFHTGLYEETSCMESQIEEIKKDENLAFFHFLKIIRLLIDLVQLTLDFKS